MGISLADSFCHAVGAAGGPACAGIPVTPLPISGNGRLFDAGLLRRELGGLREGFTYYIVGRNNAAHSIQLALTPGGAPIQLDLDHHDGPHSFGLVEVDLHAGAGSQSLYVDLTYFGQTRARSPRSGTA